MSVETGPPQLAELKAVLLDILDRWSEVEHEAFILFQMLLRAPFQNAWIVYQTARNARAQREMTVELGRTMISDPDVMREFAKVMERFGKAASKRNAIVHGRWAKVELVDVDENGRRSAGIEHYRLHELADSNRHYPRNDAEEEVMRGKTRFYLSDLEGARDEFQVLARQLFGIRERLIPFVIGTA